MPPRAMLSLGGLDNAAPQDVHQILGRQLVLRHLALGVARVGEGSRDQDLAQKLSRFHGMHMEALGHT